MTNEMKISNMLKDLGIPADLLGYRYLRYAIDLVMNDWSYVYGLTKKTYPSVAKKYFSTPTRVERAIRHAIETAWTRGNQDTQEKLFGYTVDSFRGRPTSGEFIGTVADYLLHCEEESDGPK